MEIQLTFLLAMCCVSLPSDHRMIYCTPYIGYRIYSENSVKVSLCSLKVVKLKRK